MAFEEVLPGGLQHPCRPKIILVVVILHIGMVKCMACLHDEMYRQCGQNAHFC